MADLRTCTVGVLQCVSSTISLGDAAVMGCAGRCMFLRDKATVLRDAVKEATCRAAFKFGMMMQLSLR